MNLPFRNDLAEAVPYGAPHLDVPVRLNVNENPYPPSPELVADIADAVARAATELNRYPDREALSLREGLGAYLEAESGVSLDTEELWAANGSNEVMSQLLAAFAGPGRSVMSADPTYSMYPEYARNSYSTYVPVPRGSDFHLDIPAMVDAAADREPSVILLASPNNPTGTGLDRTELTELLSAMAGRGPGGTDPIVVVDEAYGEFREPGVPSALTMLCNWENLVVTRTMSKAFGAAGLRLGYLAASRRIIDQVRIVRLPYHLSALTQAAALAALGHADAQLSQIAHLRRGRAWLAAEFETMGLDVFPSQANFLLVGPFEDRSAVFESLLSRGILVREVGPDGYIRITVGTDAENAAVVTALKEI